MLCSREEMFLVEEQQGRFYRIPADDRDLNYEKFVEVGEKDLSVVQDYNSHNTERLEVSEMVALLHKLDFIPSISTGGVHIPEGV